MKIQDILGKALEIGNEKKYTVKFFILYNKKPIYIKTKEMTYTELGMILINNCNDIDYIKIVQKEG